MKNFLKWLWMRAANAVTISVLSILFIAALAYAISYPSTTPLNETTGGKFRTELDKLWWAIAIDGSNNVGVGVAAPAYKLDVAGTVNATRFCINGDCRSTWPKPPVEYSTPGTYTFQVLPGTPAFSVEGVGAGGGWAGWSDGGYVHNGPGGGGGGAGQKMMATLNNPSAGTYTIVVWAGGGGGYGSCCSSAAGVSGGATTIRDPSGTVVFTAAGGTGAGSNSHCNDGAEPSAGSAWQASPYWAGGIGGAQSCWGSGWIGGIGAGGGGAGGQTGSCCGNTWGKWGNGYVKVTFY